VCLEEVSAGVLAVLIRQHDQAAQVHRDVVGLADVQREGRAVQALPEHVAAEERRYGAGTGDDLQDPGQDLLLQLGEGIRGSCGRVIRAVIAVRAGLAELDADADGVIADARTDQVLDRIRVDVTGDDGITMASQAIRRAASPSSQAPPSPVLTEAAARWAAYLAR
jgi:hypothetical protein